MISIECKTNFFENRVSEYKKANIKNNRAITIDDNIEFWFWFSILPFSFLTIVKKIANNNINYNIQASVNINKNQNQKIKTTWNNNNNLKKLSKTWLPLRYLRTSSQNYKPNINLKMYLLLMNMHNYSSITTN